MTGPDSQKHHLREHLLTIPPAQLERVFEPFYRAGTPGGEHRGSGLGLAIARGFAEANDGSLYVESLPGQGATFVFEFPLAS